MLGTKWPSITSTCSTAPPPSMACWASLPNCAKFDDRIDGASSIFIGLSALLPRLKNYSLWPPVLPGQCNLRFDVAPSHSTALPAALECEFKRHHHIEHLLRCHQKSCPAQNCVPHIGVKFAPVTLGRDFHLPRLPVFNSR